MPESEASQSWEGNTKRPLFPQAKWGMQNLGVCAPSATRFLRLCVVSEIKTVLALSLVYETTTGNGKCNAIVAFVSEL